MPLARWAGEEGPRWRITVSPGALAVGTRDLAKAERTPERASGYTDEATSRRVAGSRAHAVDMRATFLLDPGKVPAANKREITGWSRVSRSLMVRRLCELDYSPLLAGDGIPAMITLTYPGDWLAVAPDGAAVKRHLKVFRKRWERAWGLPLTCLWKLEFQARGAPHFHLLAVPPLTLLPDGRPFRVWLSQTWADVVGHPDPDERARHVLAGTGVDFAEGLKARDPRRIAVYFTKHGSFAGKDYQNDVPPEWRGPGHGPGRFWGYWGLRPCTAVVEVSPADAATAARVMRRWARAQQTTREVWALRPPGGRAHSVYPDVIGLAGAQYLAARRPLRRKVRRRVARLAHGRGWVSLNDAPEFAFDLARFIDGAARVALHPAEATHPGLR